MPAVICDLCRGTFTASGLKRHYNRKRCQRDRVCKLFMDDIESWATKKEIERVGGTWVRIIERAGVAVYRAPGSAKAEQFSGGDAHIVDGVKIYAYPVNWAPVWAVKIAELIKLTPEMRFAAMRIASNNHQDRDVFTAIMLLEECKASRCALVRQFVETEGTMLVG